MKSTCMKGIFIAFDGGRLLFESCGRYWGPEGIALDAERLHHLGPAGAFGLDLMCSVNTNSPILYLW